MGIDPERWGRAFTLTNGDVLGGEFAEGSMVLFTMLGEINIDLSLIENYHSDLESGEVTIVLTSSDTIRGRNVLDTLPINISLEEINLPLSILLSVERTGDGSREGQE